MNILKKIVSVIVISILMFYGIKNITCTRAAAQTQKTVKAAVFLNNLDDLFISDIKKNLENVQKENDNKIKFTFFDSKGNQVIENENIDNSLTEKFDILIVNPVTAKADEIVGILNKIAQSKIPLILYLPPTTELATYIKPYPNAVIITGDVDQAGTMEGQILADEWNAHKKTLDKNNDDIMQYVMLQGTSNYITTISRTKYSMEALKDAGIKTQELLSTVCNWDKECAKTTIESAFMTFGNKIEAIISNNDDMAIGAIETLQKFGFNTGDNSKYIPVVGIGGVPEAKKLVDQDIMTGTVVEDLPSQSKAIYAVTMNLTSGKGPLEGTAYKFDETGVSIKIPYYKYAKLK